MAFFPDGRLTHGTGDGGVERQTKDSEVDVVMKPKGSELEHG
jgi:hypothetical protein